MFFVGFFLSVDLHKLNLCRYLSLRVYIILKLLEKPFTQEDGNTCSNMQHVRKVKVDPCINTQQYILIAMRTLI